MTERQCNQEFDRYAPDYADILNPSLALSGYDTAYFDEYKVRLVHAELAAAARTAPPFSFLNFGCGVGRSEPIIARYFPDCSIFSTDVSADSIRIARENNRSLANATFELSDGATIPFERSFDVIFCAGVFHHITGENRPGVLAELKKRLLPGGWLFIFEHNPWNPLTRRVVESCPLDENASLVTAPDMNRILKQSGFTGISHRFIVFFPRWLKILLPLEKFMGSCPFGAQYCMTATTK
jgi:SAM-dependent methyltransferase